MNILKEVFNVLKQFWKHFSKRRKFQLIILIFINLFSSIFEIVTIASVMPFISAIIDPIKFSQNKYVLKLNITNNNLILTVVVIFVFLNIFSALIRFLSVYLNTKLSFIAGSDLGQELYRVTLGQNYEFHTATNSSNLISVIGAKAGNIITNGIMPAINIVGSIIMLLVILIMLFFVEIKMTLIILSIFILLYYLILITIRPALKKEGLKTSIETDKVIRLLQEGFGGIRETILHNSHINQIKKYNISERRLRNSQAQSNILINFPKFIIEPIGMIILASIAFFLYKNNETPNNILPILALITLSLQRILPILQQIFSNWSTLIGSLPTLFDTLELINKGNNVIKISEFKLNWTDSISLKNISFEYSSRNQLILKDVNLLIKKNTKVGIVGESGQGKSTLIDIICGLLLPTTGEMFIDDFVISNNSELIAKWRNEISVVSQRIFLNDQTLLENIAFGIERDKIDMNKINNSIKLANLENTIKLLPNGLETIMGERGVQLSGGQLQRIGIARAIYRESNILILDEMTSSLDSITEKEILKSIFELQSKYSYTIIMITHKLENLKEFDFIYEIKDKKIKNIT